MSIEVVLFLIIGALSITAAAMMLLTENAVHSALFLILNFMCVAFMFVMLDAGFLAIVQVAVYAGAIMVLFLFVIMLLGAEKVVGKDVPVFRWVPWSEVAPRSRANVSWYPQWLKYWATAWKTATPQV